MFIRSERLFLRPAWREDNAVLARLLGDGTVMSNIAAGDLPHTSHEVGAAIAGSAAGRIVGLLVTLPSIRGSEVIGGIGLGRDEGDGSGEIRLGYWLAERHWGHGYAAEAARGVLAFAAAIGHRRVFADQSLDDRASLLVLTRAGFRPTGERRTDRDRIAAVYVADLAGDHGADGDEGQVRAA